MGRIEDLLAIIRGKPDHLVVRALDELLPRWIPVEERLPRPGQEVLIFHRATDADGTPSCIGCDGNGGLITTATFERIEGQTLWTSEYGDETPSHWMPLPEPPPDARDVLREQWEKLQKGPRPIPEAK